jgi:dihydroorotase
MPATEAAPPPPFVLHGPGLLDPGSGRIARTSLAYAAGRLAGRDAAVGSHAGEPIEVPADALIVPGLVDLHAHVFEGVGDGVGADAFCLARGSTTVVDGGSAGAATIAAFAAVAGRCRTRVLCWLNLSTIGIIDTRFGELVPGPYLDVAAAVAAAHARPGFIVGFKARLSTYAAGGGVRRVLDGLLEAADATGLPVMVHVGDTDEPLADIVRHLRPGDVVTHALTGRKHGILVADRLDPAVADAQARGVVFDAARGANHLSFRVLEAAAEAGFLPDTLSTDMTARMSPVAGYGQVTLGTYLLSVGVELPDVVSRMTIRPGAVVGLGGEGFAPGDVGDVSVLRLVEGTSEIVDVDGRTRTVPRRLEAWATVRAGRFAMSDRGHD